MKLFKGQIEVRETDTIKVNQYYLEVVDKNGNRTYFEDSNKFWVKREYDKNGNMTYYENSYGKIIDKRAKELTVKEIEKLLGYKIKIKGD